MEHTKKVLFTFTHDETREQRLDVVVLNFAQEKKITALSRSQVKLLIEEGGLSIDQKVATKAGTIVKPGATIKILESQRIQAELKPLDLKLDLLFEDNTLMVINKPAGLTTHPGAGNTDKTLVNAVMHHLGIKTVSLSKGIFSDEARAGVVHRLDKDTSGILVVAKTITAKNKLSAQFAARTTDRLYTALAFITPRGRRRLGTNDSGTIETLIGRNVHQRTEMAVVKTGGKQAITHFTVTERFDNSVLLEVKLESGRTHQIRVHMEHIGSPLIGDQVYGDFDGLPKPLAVAASEFGRQALHAGYLAFNHPVTGKRLSFSAKVPADMAKLIAQFRDYKRN